MREIKDPRIIAELEDRRIAQEAGVDYDTVSKSRDFQVAKERTGSGWGRKPAADGSFGTGVMRGMLMTPVEGITQAVSRGGNAVKRFFGGDTKSGRFSDYDVAYNDAAPKVRESQYEEGRKQKGRSGFDAGKLVGTLMMPAPALRGAGVGRAIGTGAIQGGQSAALAPTDQDNGRSYASNKIADTLTGAGMGAATGGALHQAGTRLARPVGQRFRRAVDAARELEVPVGTGQITDSIPISQATQLSSRMIGGRSLHRAAERTNEGMHDAVERTADQMGGGSRSKVEAGGAAYGGAREFTERFQREADANYGAISNHVNPDGHTVDMTGTMLAMQGPAGRFMSNPELGQALANGRLRQFATIIANPDPEIAGNAVRGQLSMRDALELRSEVGRMMGDSDTIRQIPQRDLAQIYGALSTDLERSLTEAGENGAEALNALRRASAHWQEGRHTIDDVLTPVMGEGIGRDNAGQPAMEKVADRILDMVKNDSGRTRELRGTIGEERWRQVAGHMFRRMGEPTPGAPNAAEDGAFSINNFLTNYNKLHSNREAFNAAFGNLRGTGHQAEQLARSYENFRVLASRLKQHQALANHSGSAYYGSMYGLITMAFFAPGKAAAIVGGNKAWSTLMASPRFAQWLASSAGRLNRVRARGAQAANVAMRAQVAKLSGLAADGSVPSDAVAGLIEHLSGKKPAPAEAAPEAEGDDMPALPEIPYDDWLSQNKLKESDDYDMLNAYVNGEKPDEKGHMSDKYKQPAHMTFSNESIHSEGESVGGKWGKTGDKWEFRPSTFNLKRHSKEAYKKYFDEVEKGNTVVFPDGERYTGGKNAD